MSKDSEEQFLKVLAEDNSVLKLKDKEGRTILFYLVIDKKDHLLKRVIELGGQFT